MGSRACSRLAGCWPCRRVWVLVQADQVLIFGIAANIVAGIATIVFGRLDDVRGSRAVILLCLTTMVTVAFIIFFAHAGINLGPIQLTPTAMFWIFGLILCVFVGYNRPRAPIWRASPQLARRVSSSGFTPPRAARSFVPRTVHVLHVHIDCCQRDGDLPLRRGMLRDLGVMVLLVGLLAFIPVKPQNRARSLSRGHNRTRGARNDDGTSRTYKGLVVVPHSGSRTTLVSNPGN